MKLTLTKSLVLIISTYQHLTYLDHSLTFLDLQLAYLPAQLKQDTDTRLKGAAITRQDLPDKNPIVTHSVIQVNECLSPIQERGSFIQMSASAYLSDQLFSQSLIQPMVVQPVVSQLAVSQPSAGQPSADQCCVPDSTHCYPSSCSLTWYIHIARIQTRQNALQNKWTKMASTPDQ